MDFTNIKGFLQDFMIQTPNLIFDMIKDIYFLNGVYRILEPHSSYILLPTF